jgi:hypothetical protein
MGTNLMGWMLACWVTSIPLCKNKGEAMKGGGAIPHEVWEHAVESDDREIWCMRAQNLDTRKYPDVWKI